MLIRYDPPETFLISNRTLPERLTVKVAFVSVVDEVVTVEPTLLHVLPLLVDTHNSHVLFPSVPYLAW